MKVSMKFMSTLSFNKNLFVSRKKYKGGAAQVKIINLYKINSSRNVFSEFMNHQVYNIQFKKKYIPITRQTAEVTSIIFLLVYDMLVFRTTT